MTYSLPRKLPSLTKGQLYSMAAYALIIVDGVNSLLQQAQVAHVPLPLWVSALAIPAGAGLHNLLARSLNRSKSGTGSGVIGTPIVDPLAAPITLTPTGALAAQSSGMSPSNLLALMASVLTPDRLLAMVRLVALSVADQHGQASLEVTQKLDQAKLLSGIATKSDEDTAKPAPAAEGAPS